MSSSPQPPLPKADGPAPAERSRGWGALKGLAYGLGLLVVLIMAALLFLQTPGGARWAVNTALTRFNPFEDATLQVAHVEGNFLTHLVLRDVTLQQADSTRLAHIDTVAARFHLLRLLRQELRLDSLAVLGLDVSLAQRADSTWDLLNILPPADTTDTTVSAFRVVIQKARLERGRLTARFLSPTLDSVLQVTHLQSRLSGFALGGGRIALNLDTLDTRFIPPTSADTVALNVGAALAGDTLTVRGLRLRSSLSNVAGHGVLRLPSASDETFEDLNFSLTAAPLAFRDLAPFLPTLDPRQTLTLESSIEGSGRLLRLTARGQLSDGATLTLDAEATPASQGPLRYRLDGQVRSLNPGIFTGGGETGLVSADVRLDLSGDSLSALNGTAEALLFNTRFGDYTPGRTTLNAGFNQGRANLNLTSDLRGAAFALTGYIRPLDPVPDYDLQARFSRLDIGRFVEDSTQTSNLNGILDLKGRGFNLEEAGLTAHLTLTPSTLNGYPLEATVLDARLRTGAVDFETHVGVGTGFLQAKGDLQLEETLAYRITEGRLQQLPFTVFLADTTQSALTGTFTLSGRGTDTQTLSLGAQIRLEDSFYGPYVLHAAETSVTLRNRQVDLETHAELEAGALEATALVRPFAAVPTFSITRAAFQHLDLGPLLQNPAQNSDLNGTLTLEGRGFDPRQMTLQGLLTLDASRLNQQAVEGATLEATLAQDTLSVQTSLRVPGGTTRFVATATPFDETPAYVLRDGTFEAFNLGALLGLEAWQTNLNGAFTLEGHGFDPEALTLRSALTLSASHINDALLEGGTMEVEMEAGATRLSSSFTLPEGNASLTLNGRLFDAQPRYEAHGNLQQVNVGHLIGNDTLNARLSLDLNLKGTGLTPRTMALEGYAHFTESAFEDITVDQLFADFRLADGLLQVDTLMLRSNLAVVDGGGPLALYDALGNHASNFHFDAQFLDLLPLRPLTGAENISMSAGYLRGRLFGRPGTLRLDATGRLESLVYNSFRFAAFEGRLLGALSPDLLPEMLELNGTFDFFSLPTLTVEQTTFHATFQDQQAVFTIDLKIDRSHNGHLAGRADLRPESSLITIDDLQLRFDQDRWQLLQEASIAFGDVYRVRNFLLYTGDQQIALDGIIDFNGEQNLILTMEQFRIGAVADLLDYDDLDGTLNGYFDLTGPATAPRMSGTLNIDLESYRRTVGDLELNLDYEALRLNINGRVADKNGSQFTVDGFLPLDLRLDTGAIASRLEAIVTDEIDFTIASDAFAIGWVRPFLDPALVNALEGTLSANIHVQGSIDAPVLDGEASLKNGKIGIPLLGLAYNDIRGDIVFVKDVVRVDHIEVHSGKGSAVFTGTIDLQQLTLGAFDLTLSAEDFLAIDSREYRGVAVADMALRGTTRQPVLSGAIQMVSADIYLTEENKSEQFEPVQLTERDLRTVEQRFGIRITEADTTTFDFYQALTIENLRVELARDTWLRAKKSPAMDIQFIGNLDVQKTAFGELQVFGSIEVIPNRSRIIQFGKRFSIEKGTLTFNGPPADPVLDIESQYVVRSRGTQESEVIITLKATGLVTDMELQLGSDPQMELTDIVSYIATGRPANQSLQLGGGGGTLLESGAGLAIGQMTGLIENLAGAEFGLDVIEIEQNGLQGATLTAGKYVSAKLYVAISQPIAFNSNKSTLSESNTQVTLEYELLKQLLVRLLRSGSTIRINLLWEYAY